MGSSSEEKAPKKKAAPAKKAAVVSDSDSSSSEEDVKVVAKPSKKAAKKESSSDSSSEEKPAPKKKAAKKAASSSSGSGSDSSESEKPAKKAAKKAASSSDSGSGSEAEAVAEVAEEAPVAKAAPVNVSAEDEGKTELFVRGISMNTYEEGLKTMFSKYGELTKCKHLYQKAVAFIQYNTHEEAAAAQAGTNGAELDSANLDVQFSGDRPGPGGPTSGAAGESNTVFCGNMGFRTEEWAVKEFFKSAGEVTTVRPKDPRVSAMLNSLTPLPPLRLLLSSTDTNLTDALSDSICLLEEPPVVVVVEAVASVVAVEV